MTVGNQDLRGFAPAVDALGSPAFPGVLLSVFNRQVEVNHLVIIRIDRDLIPQVFATESFGRDPVAAEAGERYTRLKLYHADPNFEKVLHSSPALESPLVSHLMARDISDPVYRSEVFDKSDIVDRLSFVDQRDGRWFTVNLYRDKSAGSFDKEDLARASLNAPLVCSFVAKHISLAAVEEWSAATRPPVEFLENTVQKIGGRLSRREVEVCARALQGMTSEAIGLDLNVKPTTIITHRKRAYNKLDISTANELFALCLHQTISNSE